MVDKLFGPQIQIVFPNKWKQYGQADRVFSWELGDQDFITDSFAELLCDFCASHFTGLCSLPVLST